MFKAILQDPTVEEKITGGAQHSKKAIGFLFGIEVLYSSGMPYTKYKLLDYSNMEHRSNYCCPVYNVQSNLAGSNGGGEDHGRGPALQEGHWISFWDSSLML